jgi:cysteine desulfurase/selenocysteine lyase
MEIVKNNMDSKIKKDFHIFDTHPKLVYLDSAASSQTPNLVMRSLSEYYLTKRANIHRGIYKLSEDATVLYENARGKVAKFIGASSDEIIFTRGSTDSINMLLRSIEETWPLKESDEIVTSVMEHHSVIVPLQQLAKRNKCALRFASLDVNEAVPLINEKTKIVSIAKASNVLGTVNDLSGVIKKAREVGAITIIDAAQAAGHIPFNVKELDADFVFFSGHKMCGPTGVGVLYGREKLLDELNPSVFGGGMVEQVSKENAEFLDSPEKFEAGTPPIAEAIGLGRAAEYLNKVGVEKIHKHVMSLCDYAKKQLSNIEGVSVFASEKDNSGIVSFNIDGIHPHDVAQILSKNDIAVRAGYHCALPLMKELQVGGLVRASFYLYNTKSDVDCLVKGIEEVKKVFK